MRGKDVYMTTEKIKATGSPPLARERLQLCCNISTYVARICFIAWDHPRLRGKDFVASAVAYPVAGSPPLARERQSMQGLSLNADRITPACAGKTYIIMKLSHKLWDHPRLRGKDRNKCAYMFHSLGSPPLARERLIVVV